MNDKVFPLPEVFPHLVKEGLMTLSSDKRIKGGVSGKCKLCEKEKNLVLSHIAPRWIYKYIKGEDPRGRMFPTYHSIGIYDYITQDGAKNYLLCEECESIISESEKYVQRFVKGYEKKVIPELFQRFIVSIAYKGHFSKTVPFHLVKIRPQELKVMRRAILSKELI